MKKVNVFHVGPQKSGTTWLYNALIEHYEVGSSKKDSVHYMDMFYYKGESWFHSQFESRAERVILDPTYSYLREKEAPRRIYEYNANAKIMLTARNPIERAFSHYWHEKKKGRFNFTFDEILSNYDLFTSWVEPGLYSQHYKNYLEYFSKEQLKILFFDDLSSNPKKFFRDVCDFLQVDSSFVPSVIEKKINTAGAFKTYRQRKVEEKLKRTPFLKMALRLKNKLIRNEYKEKLDDVSPDLKNELVDVFHQDICELESITGRDLDAWKQKY